MSEALKTKREKTPEEIAAQVGRITVKLAERINKLATGEHDTVGYNLDAGIESNVFIPAADGKSGLRLQARQLDSGNGKDHFKAMLNAEKFTPIEGMYGGVDKKVASAEMDHRTGSISAELHDATQTARGIAGTNVRTSAENLATAEPMYTTLTTEYKGGPYEVTTSASHLHEGTPPPEVAADSVSTIARSLSEIRGQVAAAEIARQSQQK